MGNGVSSEEERYWEQACRRVLFDFEINNAEFAEYGGSWKLLHDDIVQVLSFIVLVALNSHQCGAFQGLEIPK